MYRRIGLEHDESCKLGGILLYCEKFRNEKFRNMENPFKFGTVVEGKYFTDRVDERAFLEQILDSPNHAVLISPRRFGKSSLVKEPKIPASL